MPKLNDDEYASQNSKTVELAGRSEGVTVKQLQDAILGKSGKRISRPRAELLVKNNGLVLINRLGRTLVFGPKGSAPFVEKTEEKKSAKRPVSLDTRAAQLLNRLENLSGDVKDLLAEMRDEAAPAMDEVIKVTV